MNTARATDKTKIKRIFLAALCAALIAALALASSGCVRADMTLVPDETVPPDSTPAPEQTPELTAISGASSTPMIYDALGQYIIGAGYFQKYLDFQNIQVYEQCDDTFMDAVAVNSYPQPIMCAVDICFYQDGEEVASGKLQTRDGSYVLTLAPGENTVFARIDTDMSLTDVDFKLIYDDSLGVMPDVMVTAAPGADTTPAPDATPTPEATVTPGQTD